jgi:hypothetical protein
VKKIGIICFILLGGIIASANDESVNTLRQIFGRDNLKSDHGINPYDENNRIWTLRTWYKGEMTFGEKKLACGVETLSAREGFKLENRWKDNEYMFANLWVQKFNVGMDYKTKPDGPRTTRKFNLMSFSQNDAPKFQVRMVDRKNGVGEIWREFSKGEGLKKALAFQLNNGYLENIGGVGFEVIDSAKELAKSTGQLVWCEKMKPILSLDQREWNDLENVLSEYYQNGLGRDDKLGVVYVDECAPILTDKLEVAFGSKFKNSMGVACWVPQMPVEYLLGHQLILTSEKAVSACPGVKPFSSDEILTDPVICNPLIELTFPKFSGHFL